jgi:hypothetical protein
LFEEFQHEDRGWMLGCAGVGVFGCGGVGVWETFTLSYLPVSLSPRLPITFLTPKSSRKCQFQRGSD